MRTILWCRFLVGLAIGLTCFRAAAAEEATSASADRQRAAGFVRQALEAELVGDTTERARQVQAALSADPDYAPAHWHAGEVRVGQRWLSIDDAATECESAGQMSEYRFLRGKSGNTAVDHLELAEWCATAGLADQQRVHLMFALHSTPKKAQADRIIKKLNLVRFRNTIVPAAQLELMKAHASEVRTNLRKWQPRLLAIRQDLLSVGAARQKRALDRLGAISDPAAIGAMMAVFAKCDAEHVKTVVQTIAAIPGQTSTDALVRYAVYSDHGLVRRTAAEALRPRPLFSYAPTLIDALQSPVDVQFETFYVNGQFRHKLALYQEGPAMDHSISSSGGVSLEITVTDHPRSGRPTDVSINMVPDQAAAIDEYRADYEFAANTTRAQLNERIAFALSIATGEVRDSQPRQWWDWWYDYNEIYQSPTRPVSEQTVDTTPPVGFRYVTRSVSCFPAGTLVQTVTGPLPIDKVQPGESVLAQNVDTGELAFRPVMATTIRPPSPLIEIRTARETIQATRGHPFWVCGIGWQMAKELRAVQWLHTTSGPVQIEEARQQGEAECFNLVVADFSSYFVGASRILVHDNELRHVTTATVPGLTAPGLTVPELTASVRVDP